MDNSELDVALARLAAARTELEASKTEFKDLRLSSRPSSDVVAAVNAVGKARALAMPELGHGGQGTELVPRMIKALKEVIGVSMGDNTPQYGPRQASLWGWKQWEARPRRGTG